MLLKQASRDARSVRTSLYNVAVAKKAHKQNMPAIKVGSIYGNLVQNSPPKRRGNWIAGSAKVPPMRGLIAPSVGRAFSTMEKFYPTTAPVVCMMGKREKIKAMRDSSEDSATAALTVGRLALKSPSSALLRTNVVKVRESPKHMIAIPKPPMFIKRTGLRP